MVNLNAGTCAVGTRPVGPYVRANWKEKTFESTVTLEPLLRVVTENFLRVIVHT